MASEPSAFTGTTVKENGFMRVEVGWHLELGEDSWVAVRVSYNDGCERQWGARGPAVSRRTPAEWDGLTQTHALSFGDGRRVESSIKGRRVAFGQGDAEFGVPFALCVGAFRRITTHAARLRGLRLSHSPR